MGQRHSCQAGACPIPALTSSDLWYEIFTMLLPTEIRDSVIPACTFWRDLLFPAPVFWRRMCVMYAPRSLRQQEIARIYADEVEDSNSSSSSDDSTNWYRVFWTVVAPGTLLDGTHRIEIYSSSNGCFHSDYSAAIVYSHDAEEEDNAVAADADGLSLSEDARLEKEEGETSDDRRRGRVYIASFRKETEIWRFQKFRDGLALYGGDDDVMRKALADLPEKTDSPRLRRLGFLETFRLVRSLKLPRREEEETLTADVVCNAPFFKRRASQDLGVPQAAVNPFKEARDELRLDEDALVKGLSNLVTSSTTRSFAQIRLYQKTNDPSEAYLGKKNYGSIVRMFEMFNSFPWAMPWSDATAERIASSADSVSRTPIMWLAGTRRKLVHGGKVMWAYQAEEAGKVKKLFRPTIGLALKDVLQPNFVNYWTFCGGELAEYQAKQAFARKDYLDDQ